MRLFRLSSGIVILGSLARTSFCGDCVFFGCRFSFSSTFFWWLTPRFLRSNHHRTLTSFFCTVFQLAWLLWLSLRLQALSLLISKGALTKSVESWIVLRWYSRKLEALYWCKFERCQYRALPTWCWGSYSRQSVCFKRSRNCAFCKSCWVRCIKGTIYRLSWIINHSQSLCVFYSYTDLFSCIECLSCKIT